MKKLMAANWKMYKTADEARETAQALVKNVGAVPADREVLIFPPFTALHGTVEAVRGAQGFHVGGQDVYPADEGAFTGEISPAMLIATGCNWVLTGHSERRHVLGESNEFVGKKTSYCLAKGLKVCLCIGEKLEEREAGMLASIIHTQLETGLKDVPRDIAPDALAVAYEPVWAIGTGKVAGPKEILEAHALVRAKLVAMFPVTGSEMPILYGGSVKPDNASEIVSLDNVNGVLVGGASLQAESFSRIVLA